MASSEHSYLPNLRRCFSGDAPVLSWSLVHEHLQAPYDSENLEAPYLAFLRSLPAQKILSQTVPTFQPPSPEAKNQFNAETAVINVPPSSDSSYDFDEIKNDSLWLSKEKNIDECEALRITLLEWQLRPFRRLKEHSEEAARSILRDNSGGAASSNLLGPVWPTREALPGQAASQAGRRSMLLYLFTSEQTSVYAVSKTLLQYSLLRQREAKSTIDAGHPSDPAEILQKLSSRFLPDADDSKAVDDRILNNISALERILNDIHDNTHAAPCADQYSCPVCRTNAQLFQQNTILMDIIVLLRQLQPPLPTTAVILAWFDLMNRCNFFSGFQEAGSWLLISIEKVLVSAATTSLVLLQPSKVVDKLVEPKEQDASPAQIPEDPQYYSELKIVGIVHESLRTAASTQIWAADLAITAWAIILYVMRDVGAFLKDEREKRHLQRAIDLGAASDSPTARRLSGSSAGSHQQSAFEDAIDHLAQQVDEDPVEDIVRFALEESRISGTISKMVFAIRQESPPSRAIKVQALQDIIKLAVPLLGYSAGLVGAEVEILMVDKDPHKHRNQHLTMTGAVSTAFLKDPTLKEQLYDAAANRFPYEARPFLQLSIPLVTARANASKESIEYVTRRLGCLQSFTHPATGSFASYHTIREEENINSVIIDTNASLLGDRYSKSTGSPDSVSSYGVQILAGTEGTVISESHPPIILWHHSYSCLALLGAWLDHHRLGRLQDVLSSLDDGPSVILSTLELICALLETYTTSRTDLLPESSAQTAQELLEEIGSTLSNDTDIISVVLDVLDLELSNFRLTQADVSCEIVAACISFITVSCSIHPDRILALLTRRNLLQDSGQNGLAVLFSALETSPVGVQAAGACIDLYSAIVKASIVRPTNDQVVLNSSLPPRRKAVEKTYHTEILSSHLAAFTRMLTAFVPTIITTPYGSSMQRLRIIRDYLQELINILNSTFGVDDRKDLSKKATAVLASSADFLISSHTLTGRASTSPLSIDVMLMALTEQASDPSWAMSTAIDEALRVSLEFSRKLVEVDKRTKQAGDAPDQPLINYFALVIQLIPQFRAARTAAIDLIRVMLSSVPKSQPVSLLAHLGSNLSKYFLESLTLIALDVTNDQTTVAAWKLLTVLLNKQQQWFSMVLLTGFAPRNAKVAAGSCTVNTRPDVMVGSLFDSVLDKLSHPDQSKSHTLVSMLDFVLNAQEHWILAQQRIRDHPNFFSAITSYVCKLPISHGNSSELSQQYVLAAKVSRVLVIYLHDARSSRDVSMIKKIIPFMAWLSENAVNVGGYNQSLHLNLEKNFNRKFYPVSIPDFKKTSLTESEFGKDYSYDVPLAKVMLFSTDEADRASSHPFAEEMVRANLNLSLVQSQIDLLRAFKGLCIEHCAFFAQEHEVQRMMAKVVQNCLQSNTRPYVDKSFIQDVNQLRLDLALALVRALVLVRAKGSEYVSLLDAAWLCLESRDLTFANLITNEDFLYRRTARSILLLCLQFHVQKGRQRKGTVNDKYQTGSVSTVIPIVLEITAKVVVDGFTNLVSAIHDYTMRSRDNPSAISENTVGMVDVEILLGIFQTILRLPATLQIVSQLSTVLANPKLAQSCMMLYSWSHITSHHGLDHGSTYANLSIRFLVLMSSLPPVAEELAVEGILQRISACRITQALRAQPKGVSHLETQPQMKTLYDLWTQGLLPLCLNLLTHVGRAVSAEVSDFLNQFPAQLQRATNALAASRPINNPSSFITLDLANEIATSTLVYRILQDYRGAGASAGVDTSTIAPLTAYGVHRKDLIDDIEELLQDGGRQLRARLVAGDNARSEWRGSDYGILEHNSMGQLQAALTCLRVEDTDQ